MDHLWETVLPYAQNIADEFGFGSSWEAMYREKSDDAALAAYTATRGVLESPEKRADICVFRTICYLSYATDYAHRALTYPDSGYAYAEWVLGAVAAAVGYYDIILACGENEDHVPQIAAGMRRAYEAFGLEYPADTHCKTVDAKLHRKHDEGATFQELATEYGTSHDRIQQRVDRHLAQNR